VTIRSTVLFLATICACSDASSSHEASDETSATFGPGLRTAAERLVKASNDGDLETQIELGHPRLVQGVGGVPNYRARLMRAQDAMGGGAAKLSLVGKPIVRKQGDRLYGMIAVDLAMVGPFGNSGTIRSFFVAESAADGTSWRFLDGAGLAGDVAKLRRVIPDWPGDLQLLDVQQPVFR
jgi:hypothetical protein